MSFLDVIYRPVYKKIKYNKPSPAMKVFSYIKTLSQQIRNVFMHVKRMSLHIFLRPKENLSLVDASMTVEAAVVLPVFMFFFLHLSGVTEMLRLHGKLEAALWSVGNQGAVYVQSFREQVQSLPDAGISYILVHRMVTHALGEEYLDNSSLVHGAEGLNYLRSEYMDQNECLDFIVTYQVKPLLSIFPFSYRRMSNRCYVRTWTGYDVENQDSDKKYVYVTSQGEVWHSVPECSYIHHQVLSVGTEEVNSLRNDRGKKYVLCTFCDDKEKGSLVYYTEEGERYHLIADCTAIYKDIRALVWEENMSYRPCSRCVGG